MILIHFGYIADKNWCIKISRPYVSGGAGYLAFLQSRLLHRVWKEERIGNNDDV